LWRFGNGGEPTESARGLAHSKTLSRGPQVHGPNARVLPFPSPTLQSQELIMPNYLIAHLDELPPVKCPCGFARRAFAGSKHTVASLHVVDIQEDARTHYHKQMTEIYLVLEGEGQMELDGKLVPVKPMTAIYIMPGCRHRAVGKLKIINIPVPAFDEQDEWFDD
jgi:mannose-6-phosphate isomerase-like protein (cupin superfamily)